MEIALIEFLKMRHQDTGWSGHFLVEKLSVLSDRQNSLGAPIVFCLLIRIYKKYWYRICVKLESANLSSRPIYCICWALFKIWKHKLSPSMPLSNHHCEEQIMNFLLMTHVTNILYHANIPLKVYHHAKSEGCVWWIQKSQCSKTELNGEMWDAVGSLINMLT